MVFLMLFKERSCFIYLGGVVKIAKLTLKSKRREDERVM